MTAAGAVLSGRRAAEALMVDECLIARGGVPVFDEETGEYTAGAAAQVYAGRCRVQTPGLTDRAVDFGEAQTTVQPIVLSVPVAAGGVQIGDVATVTVCRMDPELVGAAYRVGGLHHKSHATARRLMCEHVTR